MIDGIIKGTGDSRLLKIPADSKTRYISLDALLDAMIAGTFTFDLNGLNPDGWNRMGTPLNAATFNEITRPVIGSYAGTGLESAVQSITVEFEPSVVIISSIPGSAYQGGGILLKNSSTIFGQRYIETSQKNQITETGFDTIPFLNQINCTYAWAAFR